MPQIPLSGLVQNSFDWRSIVDITINSAREPQRKLEAEKTNIGDKKKALQDIEAKIVELTSSLTTLNSSDLFYTRKTSLAGNPTAPKMSASAAPQALTGSYLFNVTQLATQSKRTGQNNIGQRISPTNDVSGITVSTMNTSSIVQAGTFTINNSQITISSSDSLQDVFDAISSATSGSVTASYDSSSDTITLSSSSNITLGSAGDTSNFLQATKLFTNGSGSVTSLNNLGSASLSKNISSANLGISISAGDLTINGNTVSIGASDSLDTIFSNISSATGGAVTASYNSSTQKIELSSGFAITLGDASDTSNFLSATKLSANGSGSVSSSTSLGSLTTSDAINTYHLTPGMNLSLTAGDFTINGSTVSILSTDTLDDIFTKISSATSSAVTASYDSSTKKITLSSSSAITLGNASDTSNFLTIAMLSENESGTVSSGGSMGTLNTSTAINSLDVTGGYFTINGKNVYYDTSVDSLQNIMQRLNASDAGVTMFYDSTTDQFSIKNNTTGTLGIALDDKEGFLLEAMGLLSGGTSTLGVNALYTVNGGSTLTSTSNTFKDSSHGITGLSITANQLGSETIEVKADASDAKSKIENFITKYNELQSLIKIKTETTLDDKKKVKTSILTGNREVDALAKGLRSKVFDQIAGLNGTIKRLADIGIDFKENSYELSIKDSQKLNNALANSSEVLAQFFTDSTSGFAKVVDDLAKHYYAPTATNSIFKTQKTTFDDRVKRLDTRIETLERQIKQQEELLIQQFLRMEKIQAQSQQQMQMLARNLPPPIEN